jgi:hypothetical protein
MSEMNVDAIISKLLAVRGSKPGKQVAILPFALSLFFV